jgi:hypothetical protein
MTQVNDLRAQRPKLQDVFRKLQAMEDDPSIDWETLLELREHADPLTDDAYLRGYVMGVLDAVGVQVSDAVAVLSQRPPALVVRPPGRRRIVDVRRAGRQL